MEPRIIVIIVFLVAALLVSILTIISLVDQKNHWKGQAEYSGYRYYKNWHIMDCIEALEGIREKLYFDKRYYPGIYAKLANGRYSRILEKKFNLTVNYRQELKKHDEKKKNGTNKTTNKHNSKS